MHLVHVSHSLGMLCVLQHYSPVLLACICMNSLSKASREWRRCQVVNVHSAGTVPQPEGKSDPNCNIGLLGYLLP